MMKNSEDRCSTTIEPARSLEVELTLAINNTLATTLLTSYLLRKKLPDGTQVTVTC